MHLKYIQGKKGYWFGCAYTFPIATGFAFAGEKIERIEGFGPIEDIFRPIYRLLSSREC